ncbi:MAG: hypothetical protein H3C45_05290, partial [Bacteroidia bacterium]|nr:hypothetical protein [Bacteroidia bacterium]
RHTLDSICESIVEQTEIEGSSGLLDNCQSQLLFLVIFNKVKPNLAIDNLIKKLSKSSFDYLNEKLPSKLYEGNFHSGFSGLIWLLSYLENNIGVIEIDESTKENFKKYCFQSSIHMIKYGNYDLFMGGIGYSMYLINEKFDKATKIVAKLLLSKAETDINNTLSWQTYSLHNH